MTPYGARSIELIVDHEVVRACLILARRNDADIIRQIAQRHHFTLASRRHLKALQQYRPQIADEGTIVALGVEPGEMPGASDPLFLGFGGRISPDSFAENYLYLLIANQSSSW